ncbi:MAG: response regulator [Desulforhopalus sp.]|nr:response regulator [Desulforhopalus sp.]
MYFNNIKISSQLRAGLSIILFMVALLGIMAWKDADFLWQQTQGLYDHPLTVRRALGEVKANTLLIHRGMKDLVLAENDEERQTILLTMENYDTRAHHQFDILFDRYLGPRQDLDEAHTAFVEWKIIRDETIRLLREGRITEAFRRTKNSGVGGNHAEKVLREIEDISVFAMARGDKFYQEATEHNKELKVRLTCMVAIIILLSAGISRYLMVRIRESLRELTTAMERFHQGDMNARSRQSSTNEFGILATSFNTMTEAIALRIDIDKRTALLADALISDNQLKGFAETVLATFIEVTESTMGAFYLRSTESDDRFTPLAAIGIDPELLEPFIASTIEGQFGEVLHSGRIAHLKDIRQDTVFTFKTFAGTAVPREIITIPVMVNDAVRGMLSLACLGEYGKAAQAVLSQPTLTSLNTTLAKLLTSERNQKLTGELQQNNQELQAQQEELQAQTEELRQQTEEIRAQNIELEQQRLVVLEASRLKSQFLSNMSHELRTPLNSVMALSRVLTMQAKEKLSDEELKYLEIIERNGKNLLTLINDILDLAKIEAGRMDIRPRPFSLALTIENLIESLKPLAAEKNIQLHHDIPENLPPLDSDEIRVSQVLQNLLANAVKFTAAGSVTVSVKSTDGKAAVRITDTGIGIAAGDLPHIFDEFRQVDGSSARRHEGTGLGLAIAHKAAQMLGGDIAVTSTLGVGSTFTLSLPLSWQGNQVASEPQLTWQPSLEKPASKTVTIANDATAMPRILMIEDNEAATIQVRSVLESNGYAVDIARGGQDAFDFVGHTIPDGIILDLMMPDIDGFAVLEKIRGRAETSGIPVLILTAKDLTPEDFKKLSANNVQQLVQKGDIDQHSLLRQIRTMLGGKEDNRLKTSQPPAILVIEDNPDNMTTIKAIIGNRYRIIEATDGEEGLRVAAATRPDLILLDMALPKMDGLTVAGHLKKDPALRAIPVIAITSQVMKGDQERILQAGCDDYLAKPLHPEFFLDKIAVWLGR